MADLLAIADLRAGYGEAVVLPSMSLRLQDGHVLALLGRNGTGKTTLINSIVGITRRFGGTIALAGADITPMRPDQRARAGIGWVPQERNIFRSLTVEENMTAVARPGPWTVAKVYRMFPRLEERRHNFGNQLSGGEQQMLAIGRADRGACAHHRRGVAGGASDHHPVGWHLRHHCRAECTKDSGAGRPRRDIGARRDRA
jgi:branched-chain amino acid transport system ATP-binding protein